MNVVLQFMMSSCVHICNKPMLCLLFVSGQMPDCTLLVSCRFDDYCSLEYSGQTSILEMPLIFKFQDGEAPSANGERKFDCSAAPAQNRVMRNCTWKKLVHPNV